MKKMLGMICIGLTCIAVCLAQEYLPEENQAVLKSAWTPSPAQTKAALAHSRQYLNSIEQNTQNEYVIHSAKKILEEFPQYRVQFKGVMRGARKIIYCNFFHVNADNADWKEVPVVVDDGGYWYWQIEYDVEAAECMNMYINGEG